MGFYEELEVSSNASAETISAAFKSLSKRFHPDVCSLPSAKERYSRITEAYNVLSDPQKRKAYDEERLFDAMRSQQGQQGQQGRQEAQQGSNSIEDHIENVSALSLRLIEAHLITRIPVTYQAAYPIFQTDIANLIKGGIRKMVNQ